MSARRDASGSGRKGLGIVELLIGAVMLSVVLGVAMAGFGFLTQQSKRSFDTLAQTHAALLFLEDARLELGSLVMNPKPDARAHEGNSFLISRPNGTSIQFVSERVQDGERRRFLVYLEARDPAPGEDAGGLVLGKTVWEFTHPGSWNRRVDGGWPPEWIGEQVVREEFRFPDLQVRDLRWQYLVPSENEGSAYFRIKLVLGSATGKNLLPFTTLVSVQTPNAPVDVSDCPSMFAACFTPETPNCSCAIGGGL